MVRKKPVRADVAMLVMQVILLKITLTIMINGDGADDKAVGDGNNDDTWKGRQEPDHVEQVAMMII